MKNEKAFQNHIGACLDGVICTDPRGRGVSRLLYQAAYSHAGGPLTTRCANALIQALHKEDTVFLITGFVLPCGKGETDGMCGTVALARGLAELLHVRPFFIIPQACEQALNAMYRAVCAKQPAYAVFPKERRPAERLSRTLPQQYRPAAVISVEAPGANKKGVYHNAAGLDITALEARSDLLFEALRTAGILSIAIGDLGNETGMGRVAAYLPYGKHCQCPCGGGIAAASEAGLTLTATASDWGAYGLLAALSYLCGRTSSAPSAALVRTLIQTAVKNGLVNMDGTPAEAVDGFSLGFNCTIAEALRHCVIHAEQFETAAWGKGR